MAIKLKTCWADKERPAWLVTVIDSYFLDAAQDAKVRSGAAGEALAAVDRYDRAACEQAQLQSERTLTLYKPKAPETKIYYNPHAH